MNKNNIKLKMDVIQTLHNNVTMKKALAKARAISEDSAEQVEIVSAELDKVILRLVKKDSSFEV